MYPVKSTGSEECESIRTQFSDAQVSLGFPGTEDNSRETGLKCNGERKYRLKHKGESRVVRCLRGANIWRDLNPTGSRAPQEWSADEKKRKTTNPIAEAQGAR
ncbi:hypothetical protein EDB86DRAFT_2835741 [Lactarius hatsudake]|nr:hypothetical protein EDB86DRAFT_2835741 [Lactarius hatsudake]